MMSAMTNHQFDVLLFDDSYYCDLIFTGLPGMPDLGTEIFASRFEIIPGGAFNLALAFTRLGVKTGWPCQFGNDLFSRFVLERSLQEGLDQSLFCEHDFPIPRVTVSLSQPQDRAFVTFNDPFHSYPPHDLILKTRPQWMVEGGLRYGAVHLAAAAAAREVGARVFMDSDSNSATLHDSEVESAIAAVDVFAPNEKEALSLTGENTLEDALARLSTLAPLVIVKRGCNGVLARQGESVISLPAFPVDVVDTTGAGDCFNAGFVYGMLHHYDLKTCLQCGNISGALSTAGHGASAAPSALKLETWLNQMPGTR